MSSLWVGGGDIKTTIWVCIDRESAKDDNAEADCALVGLSQRISITDNDFML